MEEVINADSIYLVRKRVVSSNRFGEPFVKLDHAEHRNDAHYDNGARNFRIERKKIAARNNQLDHPLKYLPHIGADHLIYRAGGPIEFAQIVAGVGSDMP